MPGSSRLAVSLPSFTKQYAFNRPTSRQQLLTTPNNRPRRLPKPPPSPLHPAIHQKNSSPTARLRPRRLLAAILQSSLQAAVRPLPEAALCASQSQGGCRQSHPGARGQIGAFRTRRDEVHGAAGDRMERGRGAGGAEEAGRDEAHAVGRRARERRGLPRRRRAVRSARRGVPEIRRQQSDPSGCLPGCEEDGSGGGGHDTLPLQRTGHGRRRHDQRRHRIHPHGRPSRSAKSPPRARRAPRCRRSRR